VRTLCALICVALEAKHTNPHKTQNDLVACPIPPIAVDLRPTDFYLVTRYTDSSSGEAVVFTTIGRTPEPPVDGEGPVGCEWRERRAGEKRRCQHERQWEPSSFYCPMHSCSGGCGRGVGTKREDASVELICGPCYSNTWRYSSGRSEGPLG
jgi:hypothetical protein